MHSAAAGSTSLTLTTQHPPPLSSSTPNKHTLRTVVPIPGHSGRLKYADPKDLPSFPSVGLPKDHVAANTAASLGWANQKMTESWRPDDTTTSASAAAAQLANRDCKMPPAVEPERNHAGSQAALLAAGSAQKRHVRQSSSLSSWGNSAANIAFRASRTSPTSPETPNLARMGSMKAAKGAMARSRPRSVSSPQTRQDSYPDQANAAANALSAATIAHRPTTRASSEEGGAVPYVTMNRQMFTSHPPVKPEVDEQKRADVLHASAVAMAKRMYNQQQKMIDTTKLAHARSSSFTRHGERSPQASPTSTDELPRPTSFNNLQEAAYRLAQERLAKLHEEHQATRDMQEYYGASPTSPQRGKFGIVRAKLTRRRASSDGELMMDDKTRSRQIRKQMSLFNTRLTEMDERKRIKDREALLAAAQRNVKARLQDMDEKMFEETGRVAPSKLSEWESKAQTAARTRIDSQHIVDANKIDIGGGKLMDREEVDRIAAKRVQPLLDEINEKAEAERERRAALRLEEEKRKAEEEKKKMREREIQEIHQKLKDQQKDEEKLRKAEIKGEERAKKDELKAAKAEQKRLAKSDRTRTRENLEISRSTGKPAKASYPQTRPASPPRMSGLAFPKLVLKSRGRDSGGVSPPAEKPPALDGDSTSPTSKVKSWFKIRFSRPRAKSSNAAIEESAAKRGFIGGVALTKVHNHNDSMSSIGNRSSSMREVAMAGRRPMSTLGIGGELAYKELGESSGTGMLGSFRQPSSVSSFSSVSTGVDKFVEARSDLSGPISPPRLMQDPASGRGSPLRESRFSENLE